jgi:ATP-dependent DNA helicase UvrD/PcrA
VASRFIQEIPPELLEELRPRIQLARPLGAGDGGARHRAAEAEAGGGMRLGMRVRHGKFGEGIVLNVEGQGPHARVHVNFEQLGAKWLMLSLARLELM